MLKKIKKTSLILISLFLICTSGCGLFKDADDENSQISESESSQAERYAISTTKTARYTIDNNAEDEDLQGYTTTKPDTETGTLENPIPDEPDPDILATTTTTLYTVPQTETETTQKSKTSRKQVSTSETSFVKNKLHAPLETEMFKSKVKYKITSDTTYLNLRFGPSKKYEVRLKIPDGKYIYGTARTKDSEGNYWIYTSYEGTSGWVMEILLKKY